VVLNCMENPIITNANPTKIFFTSRQLFYSHRTGIFGKCRYFFAHPLQNLSWQGFQIPRSRWPKLDFIGHLNPQLLFDDIPGNIRGFQQYR